MMDRRVWAPKWWLLAAAVMVLVAETGCGRGPAVHPAPEPTSPPQTGPAAPELDAEDPSLLRRPFTAEQIRDEMIVGLQLLVRTSSPGGDQTTRWTVVAADADRVEIEYVELTGDGVPVGEPTVQRSRWVELRDHASFPADRSTRDWVSRDTALGVHEGWLYTVRDEQAGTISEYFFAASLPGAPIQMRVLRGQDTVMEMEQLDRSRPTG